MSYYEDSIWNDNNIAGSIFDSQVSSNSEIKIKVALRDDKKISYSLFKIPKRIFLNYDQFKVELLYQQQQVNSIIDRIYLIKNKDQIRSFASGEEWEEYFIDNDSLLNSGLKLEYTLKSKLQSEVERKLEFKGVNVTIDFISYLNELSLKDSYFNNKINDFLSEKKLTGGSKEYNNLMTDSLFKNINQKLHYCKKVFDIKENMTTKGSSSEIYKSSIPSFERFIESPDKLEKLKKETVYPSFMDMK